MLACFLFLFTFVQAGGEFAFGQQPTRDLILINQEEVVSVSSQTEIPFFDKIFGKKSKKDEALDTTKVFTPPQKVYIGGIPLGFTISAKGVVVVGVSSVETIQGNMETCDIGDIKEGDILLSLESKQVIGAKSISEFFNKEYKGGEVKVKILRGDTEFETKIHPAKDSLTGEYKLGLWIRDNSAGVGTLTYVKKDGSFGALGHAVCDLDTGVVLPVDTGNIYRCNVIDVEKSKAGKPGELRGLFLKNSVAIGEISDNTNQGVFGVDMDKKIIKSLGDEVEVASSNEIKMGDAYIRTTISGNTPIDVEIEIIKTSYINHHKQNSFVIRIKDKNLLEKTGGIVQGMSGSPIIQNGKLIGAVTHVFVNDATKGFAIDINEMIK